MTKKDYCNSHESIAYYSGLNGFEIKGIEYGIEDYLYAVSNAWNDRKNIKYHKLMIHYDRTGAYVICRGYKIPMNDCIRMN